MMEPVNNFDENQPQPNPRHEDFKRPQRNANAIDHQVQNKISHNSVYKTMEARKLDNSPMRKWNALSHIEKVAAVAGYVAVFYIVGIIISSILFL
jgi:hypothetical protein